MKLPSPYPFEITLHLVMTAAQPFPSVRYDYAEKVKLLYFAPHP